MNKQQAKDKLNQLIKDEHWGGLTTGMLKPLGITMDQFLRFAQMPVASQKNVILGFGRFFKVTELTKKHGHGGI